MASKPPNDSIDIRIPASCPAPISQILYHAWHHDLSGLKPLLTAPESARVQEPTTGESPLHAAVRSCAPANQGELGGGSDAATDVEEHAKAVVHELFMSGGIWNGLDDNDETPGCVAARLGLKGLYTLCIEAGVRAELLFGLLDGYEELESDDGEEDEEDEEDGSNEEVLGEEEGEGAKPEAEAGGAEEAAAVGEEEHVFVSKRAQGPNVNSEDYLRSNLTYSDGKLVDSAQNGVMMAWETSIMRASVDALLPDLPAGRKILNIGFGMGIIDSMFAETKPSKHHIIEAHPAVLEHINGSDSKFGKEWEAGGPSDGAYKVHAGKWQDVVPKLLEQGETYDAIYFDTFGEDYNQLRLFFTEYVPSLLEEEGRFGFFNGLGADRKICYDVYTQVVEMHLSDAGMDVEWQELDVDMKDLENEGEGEWKDVKRRYWTLDKYRLPTCTLMG
ncbi:arginine N-methyltransferase 2 [Annulohypoxylon truncatum]|uniref:arginine N-methyltransferase 2 n=1 Tax=Annulohypoxylon truncatum TaxID=327061 RepID=UPI002008D8B8|nr:arginine N-methyltransferase 2 [Annulohypoxylon truncatum]KAI1208951.1 arginine N-methyltransferase 2 [Annulohypoxylon truncatum]